MKIAVVGAGAMGSIYAGLLASAGNEVWAVDIWQEHIDAINNQGLRIEGASGDRTVRLNATTTASDVGECDLVILATKADGVESAAKSLDPLLTADSVILTIQNGLGAAERISKYRSPGNILIGVAGGFGAAMRGPGHAFHNGMELIRIGEMQGGLSARLENVAKVWSDAGFKVKAFADVHQLIWEKFICNVALSGPCTIMNATAGEVLANEHGWKIARACGLEAFAAGKAKGIHFSFDDAPAYIHSFASKIPGAIPSMLQDMRAKRRSEIDAINGMVPVVAAEVGTQAPSNELVVALVKMAERDFT